MSKKMLGIGLVAIVTGLVIGIRCKNKKEVSEYYKDSFCSEIDSLVEDLINSRISRSKYQDSINKILCCENYNRLPKKYKTEVSRAIEYAESLVEDTWRTSDKEFYSSLYL